MLEHGYAWLARHFFFSVCVYLLHLSICLPPKSLPRRESDSQPLAFLIRACSQNKYVCAAAHISSRFADKSNTPSPSHPSQHSDSSAILSGD